VQCCVNWPGILLVKAFIISILARNVPLKPCRGCAVSRSGGLRMTEDIHLGERRLQPPTIDESLDQILNSSRFKGSAQLQTLLKYIVEGSINGHSDALKERIIGIDVFGRKSDYDTADDPIVRSRVGLLRKRLAQYYESEESRGSTVQIVIPNGSYRPTFIFRPEDSAAVSERHPASLLQDAVPHAAQENPEPETAHSVPRSSSAVWWLVLGVTACVLCVLALAAWAINAKWQKSELYLVWAPILENKRGVLLYTGTINPVYLPSEGNAARTSPASDQELPATSPSPLQERPSASTSDLVPLRDGLVPPGDIMADMKVAVLLNTYNRNLSLRYGSGLPFVDLKGSPTILIGAYDNYWTMELARDLPFFFDRGGRIRERGGKHRVWSSLARTDSTISEDYAVIFRLLDSKAGGPIIAISGLTTCGTQAAAEFMTDPLQLRKLASIPRNALESKNLEFVLHASLVNCTPTSVDIVGQQVW